MMTVSNETTAYITVVEEDHLIAIPRAIPTGATVAVVIMLPPDIVFSSPKHEEAVRQAHFTAVMEAINSLTAKPVPADRYTDAELDTMIEKARKARRSS